MSDKYIDVVFDGPPGPTAGRFVEVENSNGESICFGEWIQRDDGYWCLRLSDLQSELEAERAKVREKDEALKAALDFPGGMYAPAIERKMKQALSNTNAPTEAEIRADQMRKDADWLKHRPISENTAWSNQQDAANELHQRADQ